MLTEMWWPAPLEVDRAAGAEGFVGSQYDPQAIDRVTYVVGEVAVVLDRVAKQLLLEQAASEGKTLT
jgi:hypothetical protein